MGIAVSPFEDAAPAAGGPGDAIDRRRPPHDVPRDTDDVDSDGLQPVSRRLQPEDAGHRGPSTMLAQNMGAVRDSIRLVAVEAPMVLGRTADRVR